MARRARKRNWDTLIEQLNRSKGGEMQIRMGSAGSAQVTRVRLLEHYRNLDASTRGPVIFLRLKGR